MRSPRSAWDRSSPSRLRTTTGSSRAQSRELFLSNVSASLSGEHRFYDEVFASMDVPFEPVRFMPDRNAADDELDRLEKQVHVQSLINMYRVRGHLIADLDPLAAEPAHLHPELDPATYGLTLWDLDREFVVAGFAGKRTMTLGNAVEVLRDAYCRTLAIEYMHMQDPEQKQWIQQHVEGVPTTLSAEEQRHVLDRLNAAEAFEKFLHTRYVGQKRFGLEGAESTIVLLDAVLSAAATEGLEAAVMGMAHRGRLNVLANIVGKSYREIFREFEGDLDPESVQGSGDVKYHKGASGVFVNRQGRSIEVSVASNPSHLEAVDPVVVGMVRARQDRVWPAHPFGVLVPARSRRRCVRRTGGRRRDSRALPARRLPDRRDDPRRHQQPARIHHGAGICAVLRVPDRRRQDRAGTDHPRERRRPRGMHARCAPGIRVPPGLPQGRGRGHRLLPAIRPQRGRRPSYTQPRMYAIIDSKRSVRKRYTEVLVRRGDITLDEAEQALDDFAAKLQAALDETRQAAPPKVDRLSLRRFRRHGSVRWSRPGSTEAPLSSSLRAATRVPGGFQPAPEARPAIRAASQDGGERRGGLGAR